MRKTFLLLLVISGAFGVMAQGLTGYRFREADYDSLPALAQAENKPVFIYFHFDQCPVCRRMEKSTFLSDTLREELNRRFVLYEVNTQRGEGIGINSRWEIMIHPAWLFFDRDGFLIYKDEGYKTVDQFLQMMAQAESATPSVAYYEQLINSGDSPPELLRMLVLLKDRNKTLDSADIMNYINTQITARLKLPFNTDFIIDYAYYRSKQVMPSDSKPVKFLLANKELFYQRYGRERVDELIAKLK